MPVSEFGFFTWSVAENLVFGDSKLSSFYEVDPDDFVKGIAVEVILKLIVPGDREQVAFDIHTAILSGNAASSHYSVSLRNGTTKSLISFGRCFKDDNGVPSYYSGAVMVAETSPVMVCENPLETHCKLALDLARSRGNDLAARYLASALVALGAILPL